MNCGDVIGVLREYMDEELAETTCREIEEHLDECRDCKIFVDTLRKTVTLYRSDKWISVPEDVHQRLFKTLELDDVVKVIPFPKKDSKK